MTTRIRAALLCATLVACGGTSAAPVDTSDGMIVCAMPNFDDLQGLTMTQTFVILDGRVKRYQAFDNSAFDLCDPGQEGCSLGIEDGAIVMDHLNNEGTRSQYRVDLATMEIEPRKTEPGEAERVIPFTAGSRCERRPLPDGMQVR